MFPIEFKHIIHLTITCNWFKTFESLCGAMVLPNSAINQNLYSSLKLFFL